LRIISSDRNEKVALHKEARSKQKSARRRTKNAHNAFMPDLPGESDNSATEKLQSTASSRGTQTALRTA
jgi:hypothetical protein